MILKLPEKQYTLFLIAILWLLFFYSFSAFPLENISYREKELIIKTKDPLPKITTLTIPGVSQYQSPEITLFNLIAVKDIKLVGVETNNKLFYGETNSKLDNIYKLELGQDEAVQEAISKLKGRADIVWVQPNFIYRTAGTFTPDDTSYSKQADYLNLIQMPAAWSAAKGAATTVIAIIDTGVDTDHQDLKNKIWQNSREVLNGQDDDNNGYIDDINGWDFVDLSEAGYFTDEDYVDEDNDPMDYNGHGTHVAGIAAAETNNALGIAGAAFNCTLMPLRAGFHDKILDELGNTLEIDGFFESTFLIKAIKYAADNGAQVINMSLGGSTEDTAFAAAVEYAGNKNCIIVAAVGNDKREIGADYIPAAYPEVIAVSAVTETGDFAFSYSNFGDIVELSAPGSEIYSTSYSREVGNSTYKTNTGTSMATPLVAGAAGLLLAYNPSANVRYALAQSALDKGTSGKDQYYGYGLIQVNNALLYIDPQKPEAYHQEITNAKPGVAIPVTLNITDNNPTISATIAYRYLKDSDFLGNWVTKNMERSGDVFSATIPASAAAATDIQYYFTYQDFNPDNLQNLPGSAPEQFYEILLKDTQAPVISSGYLKNDYFSIESSPTFSITDNAFIATESLKVMIINNTNEWNFKWGDSNLEYQDNLLAIDLKNREFIPGIVTFNLVIADTKFNTANYSLSLKYADSPGVWGAENSAGILTDRVVNVPNPFDPTQEGTAICYQIAQDAVTTIQIYSLNGRQVFYTKTNLEPAGYHELIWDGKDKAGDIVPNGVYFMLATIDSNGEKFIKKHYIAVLRK